MRSKPITFAGVLAAFACLALALVLTVFAAAGSVGTAYAAETGWTVTFTGDKMESDGTADIKAAVAGMQPGDRAEYDVDLHNDCGRAADWYMKNEVLRTMEQMAKNNGGSYTYTLTYTSPSGASSTVYTNDTVSGDGEGTDGLFDATDATGEWFFLDTLPDGGRARVTLLVALDPESHGNGYFDTEGELQLSFAAEPTDNPLPQTSGTRNEYTDGSTVTESRTDVTYTGTIPQTGDSVALAVMALALVAGAAAIVLLVVLKRSANTGKSQRSED